MVGDKEGSGFIGQMVRPGAMVCAVPLLAYVFVPFYTRLECVTACAWAGGEDCTASTNLVT